MLARSVSIATALALSATPLAARKPNKSSAIDNLNDLYDGLAPSVVTIYSFSPGGRGVGSGVVLHRQGFIATAAHVVESAWEIGVEFKDGAQEPADIVTLSRSEDLALLKVASVPPATFVPKLGDSRELVVGEPVFCIGAPLGLQHTLTTGIVSAIRADFGHELAFLPKNVIQTDAAINQGNSGGAVFNRRGQVIGIASFLASPTGGNVGLGFAVPSNTVRRRLFDRAIPYIGVSLRRIPEPLAVALNWESRDAMLVEMVKPGSPAHAGGLQGGTIEATIGGVDLLLGGDLIVKVGDIDIGEVTRVHRYLTDLTEGDVIAYTVLRQGKEERVDVTVGAIIPPPALEPLGGIRAKKRK